MNISRSTDDNVQEISEYKVSNADLTVRFCHSPFSVLETNLVTSHYGTKGWV